MIWALDLDARGPDWPLLLTSAAVGELLSLSEPHFRHLGSRHGNTHLSVLKSAIWHTVGLWERGADGVFILPLP